MDTEAKGTEVVVKIDPTRSRFLVRATAAGLLSSFGHNPTFAVRDFSGEVRYVPGDPQSGHVKVTVKASSLELTDDVSEKDRKEILETMRRDVLEINRYPEIVFESTAVSGTKIFEGQYRVTLQGNLTLHGVTKPHQLDAQVVASENSLRAYGDTTLKQTDFGIKLVSVAGGTLKLKDELKISFDLVAQS